LEAREEERFGANGTMNIDEYADNRICPKWPTATNRMCSCMNITWSIIIPIARG